MCSSDLERKWGKKPEGIFYDSYKLAKSFRDGLQKALWVHKDNPNKEYLREALRKMNADPKSKEIIQKKVGQQPCQWTRYRDTEKRQNRHWVKVK